jgi:UDP-N-acetyl-D-mannosaminuronic acid transferase (WecB/TagA/CpsF family)
MATTPIPIPAGTSRQILGIRFFAGTAKEAVRLGLRGGLVVAPAAPALVDMCHNAAQRSALLAADLALPDSGLMVLIWRFARKERLIRISGLEYTMLLLSEPGLREPGGIAWIMPSAEARGHCLAWLRSRGFQCTVSDCYVAPKYPDGELRDPDLVSWLEKRHPQQIVLALGGGTQERLGLFLRGQLNYRPGIHCIGAAIGFLSGYQASIPKWADALFLGWLCRCLSEPKRFIPRYWRARELVWIMLRYGENLPPLTQGGQSFS